MLQQDNKMTRNDLLKKMDTFRQRFGGKLPQTSSDTD